MTLPYFMGVFYYGFIEASRELHGRFTGRFTGSSREGHEKFTSSSQVVHGKVT
jgi:hypothetical protein